MKTTLAAAIAVLGLTALPAVASAETAYVGSSVNLRTGPDADYPRIATLRAGQRVEIYGCINDWSWCDVSSGRDRGWVSAAYLKYEKGGQRVAIGGNGGRLGLPVLSFILGTYWDEHYRDKSWYPQRSQWEQKHPQHAGRSQQSSPNRSQPQSESDTKQGAPASQQRPAAQPAQSQGKQQSGQKKPAGQQDDRNERGREDDRRPR